MDPGKIKEKLCSCAKKFLPTVLILIIGIWLLSTPGKTKENEVIKAPEQEKEVSIEEKLETILSAIDGVGEVKVLLTQAEGEEYLYQFDENSNCSDSADSVQRTTVTVTDQDRNQTGLIRQVIPSKYLGAIIVCKGGDRPGVQYSVVEAVSKVTGLGADHISVLKMK